MPFTKAAPRPADRLMLCFAAKVFQRGGRISLQTALLSPTSPRKISLRVIFERALGSGPVVDFPVGTGPLPPPAAKTATIPLEPERHVGLGSVVALLWAPSASPPAAPFLFSCYAGRGASAHSASRINAAPYAKARAVRKGSSRPLLCGMLTL